MLRRLVNIMIIWGSVSFASLSTAQEPVPSEPESGADSGADGDATRVADDDQAQEGDNEADEEADSEADDENGNGEADEEADSSNDSEAGDPSESDGEGDDEADPFDEFASEIEDETRERRSRVANRGVLSTMSRDELAADGFEFGANEQTRDSSSALLLAVTAGSAVHGIGHFYLGDSRTGWALLGIELASVTAIMGSIVFYGATESATGWSAVFGPLLQAGMFGFVYSYVADVIGTVTKSGKALRRNSLADRGFGVRANYGFLSVAGLPVRHVVDGSLVADVGALYGDVATTHDVFLDLASYRGSFGVRPLRGAADLTFVGVEANGGYLQWQGDGEFGRFDLDGRVVGSYQLGERVPHISELAVAASVGPGRAWILLPQRGTTELSTATTSWHVPFDIWMSLNVSEHLSVRGGYGTPELPLLPAVHRLLGVTHIEFRYRSNTVGDISLRGEIGDGIALWLGGGLWFDAR